MNWAKRIGIGLISASAVTLAGGCYIAVDSAERLKELSSERPRQAGYENQVTHYIDRQYNSLFATIAYAPLAMSGAAFLITGMCKRNEPEQLRLPFSDYYSE